jgi:hypothetical protein
MAFVHPLMRSTAAVDAEHAAAFLREEVGKSVKGSSPAPRFRPPLSQAFGGHILADVAGLQLHHDDALDPAP